MYPMRSRHPEFERIKTVLGEETPDDPLTAREILTLLEERGERFDSAHRVATVLGREAQSGSVNVIRDSPYRYQFDDRS